MHKSANGRSLGLLPRKALGLAALLLPLGACNLDQALTVNDPFTVTPEVARDTVNLLNTYAGARARLATAIGGTQNSEGGLILQTGLFTDELLSTDNFTTRNEIDARRVQESNGAASYPFTFLQRARAEALNAASLFETTSQKGSTENANLYNVAGYAELLLAETYCNGIPLSQVAPDGSFTFGQPLTNVQVWDEALAQFDKAIAMTGGTAPDRYLAVAGRARALLDKGDYAGAAALAATIPNTFAYRVEYSNTTQPTYNAVEQLLNEEERWGVANSEGVNGLPFRTAGTQYNPTGSTVITPGDPRVRWYQSTVAPQATGIHYGQLKYPSRSSSVVLASGYEARYIEAEAALKAGNTTLFMAKLDSARVSYNTIHGASLPLLTQAALPATATGQVDLLFRERAFTMWLSAHRLGDMRRLVRQYGRNQATVFPVGTTRNGDTYSTDVNFPVPLSERNNPQFSGCLDRNA